MKKDRPNTENVTESLHGTVMSGSPARPTVLFYRKPTRLFYRKPTRLFTLPFTVLLAASLLLVALKPVVFPSDKSSIVVAQAKKKGKKKKKKKNERIMDYRCSCALRENEPANAAKREAYCLMMENRWNTSKFAGRHIWKPIKGCCRYACGNAGCCIDQNPLPPILPPAPPPPHPPIEPLPPLPPPILWVDCNGIPNGDAVKDECGVCAGDGSTCRLPSPCATPQATCIASVAEQ